MQPSGSSLVTASCGLSSYCAAERNGSVVWWHQGTGDADTSPLPPPSLRGTQLFCTPWQCKSLNHAPLFLDREEHTQMKMGEGRSLEKSTTAKAREERSNENNGLERPEGRLFGAACSLAQPWSTIRGIRPRRWQTLTSSLLTGLKELTGRTGPISEAQPSVTEIPRKQLPVLLSTLEESPPV